jgi:hypothetical protein
VAARTWRRENVELEFNRDRVSFSEEEKGCGDKLW